MALINYQISTNIYLKYLVSRNHHLIKIFKNLGPNSLEKLMMFPGNITLQHLSTLTPTLTLTHLASLPLIFFISIPAGLPQTTFWRNEAFNRILKILRLR